MRAATLSGVRHRLAGRAGEDAYGWAVPPAGEGHRLSPAWVIAAVADGVSATAGAAAASALAVSAAVKAGAAAAGEAPTGEGAGQAPGEDAVALARVALEAAAGELRAGPGGAGPQAPQEGSDPVPGAPGATTLLVAAVSASGSWGVARVGDSSPFVLSGGRWQELFAADPEDGEQVSTATAALTTAQQPAPPVEAAGGHLDPGDVLVLLTDGLAAPLRDGPETVAPALAAALSTPPTPLTLAAVADFSRQGCHDDRTILAIWRLPDGGG